MSKRKGHRKKRRAKPPHAPVCPACRIRADPSPVATLHAIADLLNVAVARGAPVHFGHGLPFSEAGVVLPPVRKSGRWEVRPFQVTSLAPAGLPGDDE